MRLTNPPALTPFISTRTTLPDLTASAPVECGLILHRLRFRYFWRQLREYNFDKTLTATSNHSTFYILNITMLCTDIQNHGACYCRVHLSLVSPPMSNRKTGRSGFSHFGPVHQLWRQRVNFSQSSCVMVRRQCSDYHVHGTWWLVWIRFLVWVSYLPVVWRKC